MKEVREVGDEEVTRAYDEANEKEEKRKRRKKEEKGKKRKTLE